ncbi:TPA: ash family protein [Proteus mirabilis]|nr:ash family protein [Morganella morganii]HEM8846808.1 ash family protein [Proteus mirabilis]
MVSIRYSDPVLAKSSVRIGVLNLQTATHDAPCVFFLCPCLRTPIKYGVMPF